MFTFPVFYEDVRCRRLYNVICPSVRISQKAQLGRESAIVKKTINRLIIHFWGKVLNNSFIDISFI